MPGVHTGQGSQLPLPASVGPATMTLLRIHERGEPAPCPKFVQDETAFLRMLRRHMQRARRRRASECYALISSVGAHE